MKKINSLLIGTNNKGKLREIKAMLPKNIKIYSTFKFKIKSPVENGKTFEDNSIIKAKYFSKKTNLPCLADDSGLEIDILDKAPGIYSARWGGKSSDFNKAIKRVYKELDKKDKNLVIDGSSYKGKADKDIIIGTWWNHEIVQKKAQISAVSGRIIEQKVEFLGKEDVKIGDKTYKTLRFNFSSSDASLSKDKKLNTDIWYEEGTYLWVKAAFDKTGYWEYRIKTFN